MEDKTLNNLKKAIQLWDNIRRGAAGSTNGNNCPLCKAYTACKGCPVEAYTYMPYCQGTPYYDFIKAAGTLCIAHEDYHFNSALVTFRRYTWLYVVFSDEAYKHANAMYWMLLEVLNHYEHTS